MRSVFAALERNFGNIPDLFEPEVSRIILQSSGHIERKHLQALFSHEAVAVHVRGFVGNVPAANLARVLLERDAVEATSSWQVANGRGMESSDVRAVGGIPFAVASHSAKSDPSKIDRYFNQSAEEIRWLRNACDGLSPLDKLRLELDESWPGGSSLLKERANGRPYLPGIGRVMRGPTQWGDGFCHVDDLAPLSPNEGLFSANTYLELPPVGGDLHIWPVSFKNRWDFYRHAATLSLLTTPDEAGQRALRQQLPPPIVLRPKQGDLVIICTQRPHAVQGFPIGSRVSLQSFITHQPNGALSIDN